ncbi:type II secretory pathway component PulF [Breznakia blatticola]|uniref:Type II secretory pathway component PulF n=1 Tax=Breznakia blatticola TaxID=1754012 RepID=A0A4R7ZUB3_9FIRM|nr:type II secretion system F family protein [Breznakia blatticola]TDW20358.1 type II secretory pathway component PulF [Breznakia blatticola]
MKAMKPWKTKFAWLNKEIKFNKQVRLHMRMDEWSYFASLLQQGYPLQQALQLMEKDHFEICKAIDDGLRIEQLVIDSSKGRMKVFLEFFLKMTSLTNAISCACSMEMFEKKLKQEMLKKSVYPLFVLLISFFTVYVFSGFVIPQLVQHFEFEQNVMFELVEIIQHIVNVMVLCLLFVMILLILCQLSKRILRHVGMFAIAHSKTVKEWMSFYLAHYLIELDAHGLSTRQAFLFLQDIRKQPLFHSVSKSIYDGLNAGEELFVVLQRNPWISKRFKLHFTIGSSTGAFREMMISYRDEQQKRWQMQIRKFTMLLQMISYSFVGVMVICVYQVMLLPLQLLERM